MIGGRTQACKLVLDFWEVEFEVEVSFYTSSRPRKAEIEVKEGLLTSSRLWKVEIGVDVGL